MKKIFLISFFSFALIAVFGVGEAKAAFPSIAATNSGNSGGNATTHTVNLPTGISSGNLLIVCFSSDSNPSFTWNTEAGTWVALVAKTDNGSDSAFECRYKTATGSEPSTFTITTSASEASAHISYRITGHDSGTAPAAATPATETSSTPDSPSFDPSGWGIEDTLWISAYGWDGNNSHSSYPANYTLGQTTDRSTGGPGTGIAMSGRQLNATSENPGAAAIQSSDQWIASTIAVRPASADNPVPTTTSISPTSKTVGDAQFTMTVNGTSFISSSVVRFAGSDRTTAFVSSTQLTATIPATDLTTAGTFNVTVFNPTPGGGTSNVQTFTVNNAVPTTTSISPTSKTVGAGEFTMTVNGTNFISSSVVRFAGSDRTTAFVSSTQLTATIPATDLTATGTFNITVFNPTPGGGESGAQTFTVNNPVPTISSISPESVTAGSGQFTLTVNGSGYVSGSVVRFDGSDKATTFVNAGQLTATIPASDVTTDGTFDITVFNPTPGGGTSGASTFTVSATPPPSDTTPPSAITDLALSDATTSSINLTWTATGDDGTTGTATSYDIRYSTSAITDGNWASATQVSGEPGPDVAGTSEEMLVSGLTSATTYHFAMKVSDEAGNVSGLSNVPSATTSTPSTPPPPPPPPPPAVPPPPPPPSGTVTGGGGDPSRFILFQGKAYPGATLTLLTRDDSGAVPIFPIAQGIPVDSFGAFSIELRSPDRGLHFYAIKATDRFGTSAQSTFYDIDTSLIQTTVKDIFIAPTITLARTTVRKGDFIIATGSKFSTSEIRYSIDGVEGKSLATYPDVGSYRLLVNTADLSLGTHTIRTWQADVDNTTSSFSILKNFTVSALSLPAADLNADGRLDISDWSIFLFRWASSDSALRLTLDLNNDGKTDISDFSIFIRGLRR